MRKAKEKLNKLKAKAAAAAKASSEVAPTSAVARPMSGVPGQ